MQFLTTLDTLPEAAQAILDALGGPRVVALYGDMGAGKTTLVNAICSVLGVTDAASSPTYSLINWYGYPRPDGSEGTVCHLDLYRLKHAEEAFDIGLEEVLDRTDAYIFIEWPQVAEAFLPADTVHLRIEALDEKTRKIELT
jgi:tRNA threonylcarbamoyladenosine biosynthesis protein TsaE